MKYNDNGTYKDIYVKSFDTLPVGTEVDYDGNTAPTGWTQIEEGPLIYSSTEHIIGTWIDGKTLYGITLSFPNGTGQTTQKTYNLSDYGISNVSTIFMLHPSFYTNQGISYPFSYNDGNDFSIQLTTTQIKITLQYQGIADSPFVITLGYTKSS